VSVFCFSLCKKDLRHKIPDQSGQGTHDTGNLRMLDFVHLANLSACCYGVGLHLRGERCLFSIFNIILRILALLALLGVILCIGALALLGATIYFLLAPVWILWLGIDLIRKRVQLR
jgi:hypothetical protein